MAAKKGVTGKHRFKTEADLQKQVDAYFKKCEDKKLIATPIGLINHLDCDKDTYYLYKNGHHDSPTRGSFSKVLKMATQKTEEYAVNLLLTSKNATGSIFNLKVNYNWQDKIVTDNTHNGNINITFD